MLQKITIKFDFLQKINNFFGIFLYLTGENRHNKANIAK